MTQKNNKPVKSFKAGNIEASVWEQELKKKGKAITRHSVRIQKQYRDKDGEYKITPYFFSADLPRLRLVVDKAFEFIALNESVEATENM